MTAAKLKKHVARIVANSQKKPDIYFADGYLRGLGLCPEVVLPSTWLPDLLGELRLESPSDASALMDYYNQHMQALMADDFKLPAACKLSKSDLSLSLGAGKPLSEYCAGMLKALKLIDKRTLNATQKATLAETSRVLKGFTSAKEAEKAFGVPLMDLMSHCQAMRRGLGYEIEALFYDMRFASEGDNGHFPVDDEWDGEAGDGAWDESDAVEALINLLMVADDPSALAPLSELIRLKEASQITPAFIEQNRGVFWLNHDTRPYMQLRARRAWLNAHHGQLAEARAELEALLELNPDDNQANRYLLANVLVMEHDWAALGRLLIDYEEESAFMLAPKVLMTFATEGDSKAAKALKKRLHQANKYLARVLTGQLKLPDEEPSAYSFGSKEEVQTYLYFGGKRSWLAVDGSLFWLRRG